MVVSLPVRLRALRAAHGWTLEQAAQEVGINPDNLSKLERGYRKPRVGTLSKIADAYGVAVEELLSLEETPDPLVA
jgi:transcriptional regulator with XRE-family HTH domain